MNEYPRAKQTTPPGICLYSAARKQGIKRVKACSACVHMANHTLMLMKNLTTFLSCALLSAAVSNSLRADIVLPKTACIQADTILSYKILNDKTAIFSLASGPPVRMTLARECPQLKFHGYFSYIPINGLLCADSPESIGQSITTRAGLSCTIARLEPVAELPLDPPRP